MKIAIQLNNEFGNKYTGFCISNHETVKKICQYGLRKESTMTFKNFKFEVVEVCIEFYDKNNPILNKECADGVSDVNLLICVKCASNHPDWDKEAVDYSNLFF